MKPEQRKNRELTYQVGWKRGTIKTSPERNASSDAEQSPWFTRLAGALHRWNGEVLWRKAPLGKGSSAGVLMACLYVLPAVLFTMFVWVVYELSRLS
ncbi:hypothetical protein [Paenibacillus puerhi]|uniref:hypothetical protein n=1 Tax=Paenibacillus puerhi TaxID=2692622 RepID=UPI00135C7561|nr:hypothetical protein [Paenibacillus puerhi]